MINSGYLWAQGLWTMVYPRVNVEAYSGYKGEETPRAFSIEGHRLEVVEQVERWYTESHCCFRVRADDGHRYVLRYDLDLLRWELVMREEK